MDLNKPLGNTGRRWWPERNYYTLERPELRFKCQKEFVPFTRFTLLVEAETQQILILTERAFDI